MTNGTFENYTHSSTDPARRHEWDAVNLDLAIANAIRRVVLTDIPVLGFRGEEASADAKDAAAPSVDIHHNTGPLHNEIIAHRIGMIPIHFTAAEITAGPGEAAAPVWRFDLDVSTKASTKRNVTTHDFKVFKNGVELPHTETVRLFPADGVTGSPILITRLREDEHIALSAVPVISTAREHASFSPVSMCTYQFVVDPEAAANADNVLDKERAYFRNNRGDPTRIRFAMESEGALSPKIIVDKAFQVILDKIERAQAALSGEDNDYIIMRDTLNGGKGFEFVFANEDDTLGNLIQSIIYNETIRKTNQSSPVVTYVGYCCPHPLDPSVVLRLVINDEEAPTHDMYKTLFSAHIDRIHGIMTGLRAAWDDFAPK